MLLNFYAAYAVSSSFPHYFLQNHDDH